MESQKIPEFLFVAKIREIKIRAYKLIKPLSNGKFLYEDIDSGFKECFLYADIFANTKYQKGYSNMTYKEQDRNEKVRRRRRRNERGVAYERRFK